MVSLVSVRTKNAVRIAHGTLPAARNLHVVRQPEIARLLSRVVIVADAPAVEVHFLDYPDKELNEIGTRGIGEIGLAGVAAATTDAV